MNAEFWPVGAKSPQPLGLTPGDVCTHVIADWMPSLPAYLGRSFVGWPPYLLKDGSYRGRSYLCLTGQTGRAERQWKGFLAWMLGIAGTRHVLENDGYRWIAPVSAFLDNAVKPVAISGWPSALPRSIVKTKLPRQSKSRFLPDYLALRPTTRKNVLNWAVVESKGTHRCLTNRVKCPENWHDQARNVQVSVRRKPILIPRHLVVATRVNPNARTMGARRLQIRAWNSIRNDNDYSHLPEDAVVDLVSAHLFGLFRGLRLFDTARAVAYGMQVRSTAPRSDAPLLTARDRTLRAANEELQERATSDIGAPARSQFRTVSLDTEVSYLEVRVDNALVRLAQVLALVERPEDALAAIKETDERLDSSESASREADDFGALSTGIAVRIRRRLEM